MNARNMHDEPQDSPILRSIPKVDPFVVPDGFFERFPHQVQARIARDQAVPSGWRTWLKANWRVATAAAVLGLIAVSTVVYRLQPRPDPGSGMARMDVAPSELDLESLDDHDLYALVGDGSEPFAQVGEGLSDDELADYLEQEELPLDLLIEEL